MWHSLHMETTCWTFRTQRYAAHKILPIYVHAAIYSHVPPPTQIGNYETPQLHFHALTALQQRCRVAKRTICTSKVGNRTPHTLMPSEYAVSILLRNWRSEIATLATDLQVNANRISAGIGRCVAIHSMASFGKFCNLISVMMSAGAQCVLKQKGISDESE